MFKPIVRNLKLFFLKELGVKFSKIGYSSSLNSRLRTMIEIDGSYKEEGGGALLRVSTALSALTGKKFLVKNIRVAGRPKPWDDDATPKFGFPPLEKFPTPRSLDWS